MLIKTLGAILAAMALALIIGLIKTPVQVTISRSIVIAAPAASIYPYLDNPQRIHEWNPFTADDPSLEVDFSGPREGVGAKYAWSGEKAGLGQATIVEVEENRRVALRLEFKKPFETTNYGHYRLEEGEGATTMLWSIDETAFVPRFLSVFIDLDRIVGSQFERGLAKLKSLAESHARLSDGTP